MLSKLLIVLMLFSAVTIISIIMSIFKIYKGVKKERLEATIREKEFIDSIKKAK
ncbi:putative membrane protein [Clostridium bornimense]|uniref:Putative membrane protein n=1 Tax=Clostridium bornimense TaxID=1216932 RepID=W6S6F9_9CLOT|nr:hypothetical protein [Clostridium bornimense]CDM69962.1 putative membrane protein [Clostridium bornimense]